MTTLAEARDAIHVLAKRRMTFLRRRAAGELVSKFRADSIATSLGRELRDRLLNVPPRHAALLAGEFGVDARRLLDALDAVLRAFCTALADNTGPNQQPQLIEQPPEPPIMKLTGFFPSYVDNEWASAWRLAHPAEALAQSAWEAKILDYFIRHGITPQPGQAGYSQWLHVQRHEQDAVRTARATSAATQSDRISE
jgi:hypothetical protein